MIDKTICSNCNSENVIPVVMGTPTAEEMKLFDEGKLKLGGCCALFDNPLFHCKDCGYEWGSENVMNNLMKYRDFSEEF